MNTFQDVPEEELESMFGSLRELGPELDRINKRLKADGIDLGIGAPPKREEDG